jgi:hypothetical protein
MLTLVKRLFATRGRAEPAEEAFLAAEAPSEPQAPVSVPPREQRSQDQILLFLVDLVDEMDGFPQSSTGCRDELALVRSRILDRLLLSDAELIRDDTWNPDRQRAVAASDDALVGGSPRIGSSRVSGLCVGGRVVRKQEVILESA